MLCKYLCVLETKETLVAEGNICLVQDKSLFTAKCLSLCLQELLRE